jgi:hypothetical protein
MIFERRLTPKSDGITTSNNIRSNRLLGFSSRSQAMTTFGAAITETSHSVSNLGLGKGLFSQSWQYEMDTKTCFKIFIHLSDSFNIDLLLCIQNKI